MNEPPIARTDTMKLDIHIEDPVVVQYLKRFDADHWKEKVMEALKVGVIAIENASPTLDNRVVQEKFDEVEDRLKEYVVDFQKDLTESLEIYFKDKSGSLPRRLGELFGDKGSIESTFSTYFDPTGGKVAGLLHKQIGPGSDFCKTLDPSNKEGAIVSIENKVKKLVETKLDDVLKEFSLDDDRTAMSRMKVMLEGFFDKLNKQLGVHEGKEIEAERGHVKGIDFESDLYERVAEWGRQMNDHTEAVGGTVGVIGRCKKGDYVSTLGDETGAPGLRIVFEAKDKPMKLKDAISELQEAKTNREAVCGIFAFSNESAPEEIGDFHRIGDDFYCTVDKETISNSAPLTFLEQAYKIARVQAVTAKRKGDAGKLDLDRVEKNLEILAKWAPQLGDLEKKARLVQGHCETMEKTAKEIKEDLEQRLNETLEILRLGAED